MLIRYKMPLLYDGGVTLLLPCYEDATPIRYYARYDVTLLCFTRLMLICCHAAMAYYAVDAPC